MFNLTSDLILFQYYCLQRLICSHMKLHFYWLKRIVKDSHSIQKCQNSYFSIIFLFSLKKWLHCYIYCIDQLHKYIFILFVRENRAFKDSERFIPHSATPFSYFLYICMHIIHIYAYTVCFGTSPTNVEG